MFCKKSLAGVVLSSFLSVSLFGCMSSVEFEKWVDANKQIALMNMQMAQRPLVHIEWCDNGTRVCKLEVYSQASLLPYLPQKKDSEWVRVADRLISVGGLIGGIAVTGNAMKGIINAVGKNAGHNIVDSYNTSGSYNTDRHDINYINSYNTDRHDINNSYNTSSSYNTDRHDINDSYNTINSHNTDRHDVSNDYYGNSTK